MIPSRLPSNFTDFNLKFTKDLYNGQSTDKNSDRRKIRFLVHDTSAVCYIRANFSVRSNYRPRLMSERHRGSNRGNRRKSHWLLKKKSDFSSRFCNGSPGGVRLIRRFSFQLIPRAFHIHFPRAVFPWKSLGRIWESIKKIGESFCA